MGHFTRYLIMAVFSAFMYACFDLPVAVAVGLFAAFGGGLHFLLDRMEGQKEDRTSI